MSTVIYSNLKYPPDYYTFQPGDLVFPGDGGFWMDFGDWDNMYQDLAMTTKITAAGQKVAAVRDKGRNGMHHIQNNPAQRPTAVIQSGTKCLDFNAANEEFLGSVNNGGMALATCHNMIVAETDTVTNFQRFLSTSSSGQTDTTGSSGLAVNSGDASNLYDVRALAVSGTPSMQVRAGGAGNTPFGLYEFRISQVTLPYLTLWQDNVQKQTDSTKTGTLSNFSAGYSLIGAFSSNNGYAGPAGCLDGRIWQMLHLGTIPSPADEARAEAWFDKWRY